MKRKVKPNTVTHNYFQIQENQINSEFMKSLGNTEKKLYLQKDKNSQAWCYKTTILALSKQKYKGHQDQSGTDTYQALDQPSATHKTFIKFKQNLKNKIKTTIKTKDFHNLVENCFNLTRKKIYRPLFPLAVLSQALALCVMKYLHSHETSFSASPWSQFVFFFPVLA